MGYKAIFVPFTDGEPSGDPQDILTGFVNAEGKAMGRPVGVVINAMGALLVADDGRCDRSGLPISSSSAEGSVDDIASAHMEKSRRMR